MSTRLFAVIVGIDQYKSGDTWDLQSCVDDAKRVRRWLRDDLAVPREHISMLLDEHATKQKIEAELSNHLLNNDAVEPGDAVLIYFACHGSSMKAPSDWTTSKLGRTSVEILCTYDHDTKHSEGRVAGISARDMHSFLQTLSSVKGDNITLIIDSCFSCPKSTSCDRQSTRWTSTHKATSSDLAVGSFAVVEGSPNLAFHNPRCTTHTVINASGAGGSAIEGKDGGKFTTIFLQTVRSMHLHNTPLQSLIARISHVIGEGQHPQCSGKRASLMLFGGIPFVQDGRFIPVQYQIEKGFKIEIGSQHGVVKGGEFSLHLHNYIGSQNPAVATVVVHDIYPTWCTGKSKVHYPLTTLPKRCWALLSDRPIVGSLLRKSCTALLHRIWIQQHRHDGASQERKGMSRAVSYEDMGFVPAQNFRIGFPSKKAGSFPRSTKLPELTPVQAAAA
ncbi:hypothetical protein E1B28_000741 [Marasmius oreades]|uniref:Uncharacterized protein n=1 Tax=Marasmius oreades TaxID=181124 RepID=A0A9P7V242_9AGAR|nr:uncharacterized protein E1B28_000741 [Marasmius oreades]KAG7098837.1 hypothetical protein E1B28_000741 [Marasmius oreades]